MNTRLFSLILTLSASPACLAEDVTQFRGNLGVSKETNLPVRWSASEGLRWKANLPGKGLSNPVIANGRVYVTATAAYEQKREVVLCFDVKTGKKLWERQVYATGSTQAHPKTNMAAPTPMTDGERVYALFATCDLVCYDKDGDLVWYRSLVGDYPTVGNNVGMAASPAIHGDLLIVCLDNVGESFAAAIDKHTGKNVWRVPRPRNINWVSPIVIQNGSQFDVLFQGATGIDAHDVLTGKKKWSAPNLRNGAYASLTSADGVVFASSDKFYGVRPSKGDGEPEILWNSLKMRPGYCTPVASNGLVHVVAGGGIVHCGDAKTGELLWTHRLDAAGSYSASPLLADGKLYVVNEAGITSVLQVNRKEAKLLAANKIGDTILASPVASDGAIFLRSDSAFYCIGGTK